MKEGRKEIIESSKFEKILQEWRKQMSRLKVVQPKKAVSEISVTQGQKKKKKEFASFQRENQALYKNQ